ncbi:MAG: type IX secretion system membrane protein PorP/SprF [Bacteroidota bacterium]
MKRKLLMTIPILCLCVFAAKAQQEPIFSNYIWNPMAFNPAIAGSKSFTTMNLTIREQWVGFEGRPRTQAFNVHTPIKKKRIGVGASIINDNIGPINSTTLQGNFAYKFKVQRGVTLALGLKAEASLWQGKFAGLELADDPALANNIRSAFLPNFGFGGLLKSKDYFVGIAAPRLFTNEFNDGDANWNQGEQVRHFYLHGGYTFELKRNYYFKPNIMVNYVQNVPVDATISANFEFENQLWLGASYRAAQSITPTVAYKFNNQIKAGYAYEFMVNNLISHQWGSHELMITYDFYYRTGRVVNPIFF